MNRNPDGTPLTDEQLVAICKEIGVDTGPIFATHNKGLIRSGLLEKTKQRRFELFMGGRLTLDTRRVA